MFLCDGASVLSGPDLTVPDNGNMVFAPDVSIGDVVKGNVLL